MKPVFQVGIIEMTIVLKW